MAVEGDGDGGSTGRRRVQSDRIVSLRGTLRPAVAAQASRGVGAGHIVEGCARRTLTDYLRFINMAQSSASEARYYVHLSQRLGYMDGTQLTRGYGDVIRGLQGLLDSLGPRAEA